MPRLSFRCVVTHHDGSSLHSRRDTWIDAHDFRELALAATAELQVPPGCCEYKLFVPDVGKAFVGVLLEVMHEGVSALVGPMGGPAVPAALTGEETCTFGELIASTGFDAEARDRGIYPVTVVYAGLLADESECPPPRAGQESAATYRARCASALRLRLARGRLEGFHALPYAVAPAEWRAEDLEALLGRVHALLPEGEPPWRESGTIRHVPPLLPPGETPEAGDTIRCALEVQRGDFVGHLRLPAFPVSALADWLACRPCEISLCHPMSARSRPPSLVRERAPTSDRVTVRHDHERTAGLVAACLRRRPLAWSLVEGRLKPRLGGAGGGAADRGASHDLGAGTARHWLDPRGGPPAWRRRAGAA
jgi:hypothetical protein